MRLQNPLLDDLIARETAQEILAALTPIETIIAWLRLNGWTNQAIANRLGYKRQSVSQKFSLASKRIATELPHARSYLNYNPGADAQPPDTVSAKDAARLLGHPVCTIHYWCNNGTLPVIRSGPRARRVYIPIAALEDLKKERSSNA